MGERGVVKGQFTYQDFDLLIEPGPQGSYRARVLRSPAGESAPVQFTLPFSPVELENFVLKVSRGRRRSRGPGRPESAPLKDFGGKLYDAVFQEELRDTLQRSLSRTWEQHVGMRLRLRLADTPELAELPWEFLYDSRRDRFLAQSRRTPLVRYLDLPDPPQPLAVEGPLRLLVMISSPSDYPELDVEQEWNLLTGALAEQQSEGRVVIERLAASMKELRQRLRREQFHVFHFVGHGRYRADCGSGVLVMEDRYGRSHEVPGDELGGLLNEYDQTRLAVLNACEGARSDDVGDPFAGMAQSLVRQGLPAVVAMQFEITDDAAITFAQELYGAIADGFPLEAALAEARGAIRDEGNPTEWGTPVLYSRAPDGQLFNVTKQAGEEVERRAAEQAEQQAQEEADRKARQEAEQQAQEEAERRASDLAARYALACTAADTGDWDQAIAGFAKIAEVDPSYLDVQERAEKARKQQQIVRWQADVRRLHQAGQWAGVVKAGQQLHALDPAAADPEGLVTAARAELAAAEQAERLDADYETALRLLDAGESQQAIEVLERVAKVNPVYRGTPALLDRARRQLADSSSPEGPQSPEPQPDKESQQRVHTRPVPHVSQSRTLHVGRWVEAIAFSPDSMWLAIGTRGKAQIWDLQTGTPLRELRIARLDTVYGVAFSPDGTRLAYGGQFAGLRIADATTGEEQAKVADFGSEQVLAFSPDGTRLASYKDKGVSILDASTGRQRLLVAHPVGSVKAVAFSPDGTRLATAGGQDKTARIWSASTGRELIQVSHDDSVLAVAFSPDGTQLATGADYRDKTARIWDVSTGLRLLQVSPESAVQAVAFSPDGTQLATCSYDKTVHIWDASTGQQQLSSKIEIKAGVATAAFSPDTTRLACGGNEREMGVLDITWG